MGTFCIGQFASIAFPSTIVAIAITLVSSIALWVWLSVCAILHIPVGFGEDYVTQQFPLALLLSGGFIIVLPLLASYLRVSRWFQETASWKQWVIPSLPIGTLVIGLPIVLGLWRVYSIPSAELPSAFASFDAQIAETEGTRAYRQVFSDLPNMPNADYSMRDNLTSMPIQKWLGVHPDFVEELTEAITVGGPIPDENRMRVYSPIQFGRQHHGVHQVMMAATCLLHFARNEAKTNNLEAALQHYKSALTMAGHLNDGKSNPGTQAHAFEIERAVYDDLVDWAMHKGNTAENVQKAAVYLFDRRDDVPPNVNALLAYYHQLNEALADGVSLQNDNYETTQRAATISALMPWEKTRAQRYMKLAFSREYDRILGNYDVSDDETMRQEAMYAATTLGGEHMAVAGSNLQRAYQQTRRRSAVAQLAMIAYKLETGEYPDSLMAVRLDGKPLSAEFGSFTFVRSKAELFSAPCLTYDAETILLPQDDFSLWTEDQFDERLGLSAPAQIEYELGGMSGFGSYEDETVGNFAPQMFELLSTLKDEATGENAAEQLLIKELRHMLEAGSKEHRLQLMASMYEWVPVEMFTTELLKSLDGQDVEVAGAAARSLETLLSEYDWDQETVNWDQETVNVDSAVLERASTSTNSNKVAYRLPIRNPNNGNYYEVISPELGFEYGVAEQDQANLKCIRTFRGIQGKLADLKREDEFIKQAFPNHRRLNRLFRKALEEAYRMPREVLIEYVVEEAEQDPADDDATD